MLTAVTRKPADRASSGAVNRAAVDAAISQLQGTGQGAELVEVINAFDIPKISYDPVGRKMLADSAPRSMFADVNVGLAPEA